MKSLVARVLFLAMLLTGCVRTPAGLLQVSPEEAGLLWQECEVTGFDLAQAEACFGPWPERSEAEVARYSTRTATGLRLTIGSDVYETRHFGLGIIPGWPCDPYVLLKNGRPVSLLWGEFLVYDPDVSLQEIAGKAAWEFSDPHQATIVYNGQDLRRVYGLQAAYCPYELGGKLAFIGKRAGCYFLVYDGRQVGPAFDDVTIAYCCESVLYSPRGAGGHYRFWGERGGKQLAVEVTSSGKEFAIYLLAETLSPVEAAQADLRTLEREEEPILSSEDIVAYDWETHEITLTPAAIERIRALKVPTSGIPFVVCVGREPIYQGAFWTAFSSQSYDGVVIETLRVEQGSMRIALGYPGPDFYQGQDPRSDGRILQALEEAGKRK